MADERAQDEGIAACSDAERRRAERLAEELRAGGRTVRVIPLWVRPAWWLVLALCAGAGVLASALAVDRELLGLVLAGGALLLAIVDLATGAASRHVGPRRATQAVVAAPIARPGERAVTVLLTCSLDDRRRGLAAGTALTPVRATLTPLVLLTLLLALRALGADGAWLDVLQLLPTLALLAAIALLLDIARTAPQPAATDAPAAVLAAAERLEADPPRNVDVAVVLSGAGDALGAGLTAWLRLRRRRGLAPQDVAIVHLEGDDAPWDWRAREGVLLRTRPHAQLAAAAQRAARAPGQRAPRAVTPAGVAGSRGWPAITIGPDAELAERLVRELDALLAQPAS